MAADAGFSCTILAKIHVIRASEPANPQGGVKVSREEKTTTEDIKERSLETKEVQGSLMYLSLEV